MRGRDGGNDQPPTMAGFDDITDQCPACRSVAYSCMAAANDSTLLTAPASEGFIPCIEALKKWIEPPARPVMRKSKWHGKAKQEAMTILLGSFVSLGFTGFILGGGRLPTYWFGLFAAASAYFAGKVFYANYVKAVAEDNAMERAYNARLETWRSRMSTYAHLYYCPHCATIHDSKSDRRTPWYEFLELMIYPESTPASRSNSSQERD